MAQSKIGQWQSKIGQWTCEHFAGWGGAQAGGPLAAALPVPPGSFCKDAHRRLPEVHEICEHFKMPWVCPPFFVMKGPKGTTPLMIDPECHVLLMYALVFGLGDTSTAKFRVPGVKSRRPMIVSLAQGGELRLLRADQHVPFNIHWVSTEVQDAFLAVRKRVRAIISAHAELAEETIQFWLLQIVLESSEMPPLLAARVQQYCYSTNSWTKLDLQDMPPQTSSKEGSSEEGKHPTGLWEEMVSPKNARPRWTAEMVSPTSLFFPNESSLANSGTSQPAAAQEAEIVVKNTFLHGRAVVETRRSRSCPPSPRL